MSWKTITTRAQKKRQQEKAKNLNQDENQEKLDENFSSELFVKNHEPGQGKIYSHIQRIFPLKQIEREVGQEKNI